MGRKKKPEVKEGIVKFLSNYGILKSFYIDGELYYNSKDFINYILNLENNHREINISGFVLNRLTQDFNLESIDFWEKTNSNICKLVIKKIDSYFSDWTKMNIVEAMLKSSIDEDLKLKLLGNIKSIPSGLHHQMIQDKNISQAIRQKLFNFKIKQDLIEKLILNEEDKNVLNTALDQIDIEEVSNPQVIELLILEDTLATHKRLKLIEKCSNTHLLEEVVFNSEKFEIVKAARKRIKELPNSIKFLNKVA